MERRVRGFFQFQVSGASVKARSLRLWLCPGWTRPSHRACLCVWLSALLPVSLASLHRWVSSPFGAVGPSPPVLVSSLANLEEEVFPADRREHPGEHPGILMERAGPEAQLSTPCIIYLLIPSSGAGRRGGQDHLRAPAGVP